MVHTCTYTYIYIWKSDKRTMGEQGAGQSGCVGVRETMKRVEGEFFSPYKLTNEIPLVGTSRLCQTAESHLYCRKPHTHTRWNILFSPSLSLSHTHPHTHTHTHSHTQTHTHANFSNRATFSPHNREQEKEKKCCVYVRERERERERESAYRYMLWLMVRRLLAFCSMKKREEL